MDIRKLQRAIVDGLEDVKAQDILVFNTEHLSPLFERVIVASGTSNRQTKALAASVRDAVRSKGFQVMRTEGEDNGEWIIVDCGAAVVHVMQPAIRSYYHLEEIWGDKPVKLKLGEAKTRLVKASEPLDEEPAPRRRPRASAAVAEEAPARKVAAKKPAAKKVAAKKPAAKKAPSRRAAAPVVVQVVGRPPAQKLAAKKVAAKKAAAKQVVAKRAPARPAPAAPARPLSPVPSKTVARPAPRTSAKTAAAPAAPKAAPGAAVKQAAAKKATPKTVAVKKPAAKKAGARKAPAAR